MAESKGHKPRPHANMRDASRTANGRKAPMRVMTVQCHHNKPQPPKAFFRVESFIPVYDGGRVSALQLMAQLGYIR